MKRPPFSNVCPVCGGECWGVSDDPTPRPIEPGMIAHCICCGYTFTHDDAGNAREFTDAEIKAMAHQMIDEVAAKTRKTPTILGRKAPPE